MKSWTLLLAALAPGVAAAQTLPVPYVSAGAGAAGYSGALRSVSGSLKAETSIGPDVALALGWRLGASFRVELQGDIQNNDVSNFFSRRVTGNLENFNQVGGHVSHYDVVPTIIYDLPPIHMLGSVRPYAGVGAGYGWLNFGGTHGTSPTIFHLPENNTVTEAGLLKPGEGGAFAYRALVGARVPLAVRGLELTGEYRFTGLARADIPVSFTGLGNNLVNGKVPAGSTRDGFVARDNAILIGLRYRFGAGRS